MIRVRFWPSRPVTPSLVISIKYSLSLIKLDSLAFGLSPSLQIKTRFSATGGYEIFCDFKQSNSKFDDLLRIMAHFLVSVPSPALSLRADLFLSAARFVPPFSLLKVGVLFVLWKVASEAIINESLEQL